MVTKCPSPAHPDKVMVVFWIPASIWAEEIALIGDFNGWRPDATPLRRDEERWYVALELDRDQAYRYCYLVDQQEWMSDWQADAYTAATNGVTVPVVQTAML